ncbi:MAG TPA: class E sortase [Acidimicrobiales bacterium]|nr:class E sortase [Acidimicrobiales bacterium]
MLRTTLAVVGRLFLAAGTLLGLFVAYLLWGTGVSESHSQATLARQFHAQAQAAKAAGARAYAPVLPGYAIGIIQIPKIGLEKYLVEGTGESDLQEGPGHYNDTPLPGQPGNVAIAGHRTTYGAPFYNLDALRPGDRVSITMVDGTTYTYDVTGSQVVSPSDVAVVGPTKDNRLTLTTCNPRFSASTRLIVSASLVGAAAPAPAPAPAPATPAPSTKAPPTASPTNLTSGQSGAIPEIVLFGGLGVAVWLASWAASRRVRWWAWVGGTPVFLVVLYFFFENLVRILPASV